MASGQCVIEQLPAGVVLPFGSAVGQPTILDPKDSTCGLWAVDTDFNKIGENPVVPLSALRCVGGTNSAQPKNATMFCYTTDQKQIDKIKSECGPSDLQAGCKLLCDSAPNPYRKPDFFLSGAFPDDPTKQTQIQRTKMTYDQFMANKQLCPQGGVYTSGATACRPTDGSPPFVFGQTMGVPADQSVAESVILPFPDNKPYRQPVFPNGFPSQCQVANSSGSACQF